jgi:hypothetical protein
MKETPSAHHYILSWLILIFVMVVGMALARINFWLILLIPILGPFAVVFVFLMIGPSAQRDREWKKLKQKQQQQRERDEAAGVPAEADQYLFCRFSRPSGRVPCSAPAPAAATGAADLT